MSTAIVTQRQVPSGLLLKTISAEESEFLASETLIRITSNVDHSVFHFISGTVGPLVAGLPCDVPLWLALQLRKTGKCTIATPDWMTVPYLEQVVKDERESDLFSAMPFHYIEIAQLLLTNAREDVSSPDQVQVLLQDIENIRMSRATMGLLSVANTYRDSRVPAIKLANISSLEILSFKRFLSQSLALFDRLIDNESVIAGRSVGAADGGGGGGPAPMADRTSRAPLRRLRRAPGPGAAGAEA